VVCVGEHEEPQNQADSTQDDKDVSHIEGPCGCRKGVIIHNLRSLSEPVAETTRADTFREMDGKTLFTCEAAWVVHTDSDFPGAEARTRQNPNDRAELQAAPACAEPLAVPEWRGLSTPANC
jgi:hypothetical protein